MIAQLVGAAPAQTHDGAPLDELIHEISGFDGPALWDFTFFDDCLLGEDLFSNGSAIPAHIGSPAHH